MGDVTCVDCGRPFERARFGPAPKRCPKCKRAMTLARVAAHNARVRATPATMSACAACGVEIERTSPNGPLPTRCSDCLRRVNAERAAERRRTRHEEARARGRTAVCRDCLAEFRHSYKGPIPKRCSECYLRYRSIQSAARFPDPEPVPCEDCGVEVQSRRKGPNRRRCLECARQRQAWQIEVWAASHDEYRYDKWRRHKQRRRAAKWAVVIETFSHREIFDRDGWACQICGFHIDRHVKYPDPRSASLDHIVPLSRGGPHTRANVRLTCLACNLEKSDKLAA